MFSKMRVCVSAVVQRLTYFKGVYGESYKVGESGKMVCASRRSTHLQEGEGREGRKEGGRGRRSGRKEGRKEGGRGRRSGRKEGRKEGGGEGLGEEGGKGRRRGGMKTVKRNSGEGRDA